MLSHVISIPFKALHSTHTALQLPQSPLLPCRRNISFPANSYPLKRRKFHSPGCNHLCRMLQFGSKHVCIEDVHIFKHCHEMTLFLFWIGTYCLSCVVQQTSGVKDLSSLVRYDDSSLAAIRHVQSIVPVVRPRPNIRSHSVLLSYKKLVWLNNCDVVVEEELFSFSRRYPFLNLRLVS